MRFFADENVPQQTVLEMRKNGHCVYCVTDILVAGSKDGDVLKAASDADLILITQDRDFGELVVRHAHPVAGVLLLELDRLSNEAEAARVVGFVRQNGERLAGNLVVLEPGRARIRPLAIDLSG